MRALAYVWRLIGALLGALVKRDLRRGKEAHLPHRDVAHERLARSSSPEVDTADAGSPTVPLAATETSSDTAKEPPSAETEGQYEVAPASEGLQNGSNELEQEAPSRLADTFQQMAKPSGTPPEAALSIAAPVNPSAHTHEALELAPVLPSFQLEQASALSTPSAIPEPDESRTETAEPMRGPMNDVAAESPPVADEDERAESVASRFGPDRESISKGEEDLLSTGEAASVGEGSANVVVAPEEGLGENKNAPSFHDDADSGEGSDDDTDDERVKAEPAHARLLPRQPRAAPSERHPEPVTEYTIGALPPPSTDYRTWNRAIAEHLLLQTPAGSDVYLTITPRILARALVEAQGTSLNAEQAEEYFANSVSDFYRARVLSETAGLRVMRRNGDDGLPECIGFLALAVLAAYRMRSDEEATGLAYYLRLAGLLRCDLSGPYPPGFDPFVFESLWFFLRDWLAQRHGGRLVVPAPETGSRRFVALALAHVPLRSLDIEKLPGFFVWAGYQPSSEVPPERLAPDFARWLHARGVLTPTGVAAFSDARRPAVTAQIRVELESWDGTCDESLSRRSAAVEILFDPVQHRPDLFYVPRRPPGFPARFDDGVHAVEASDEGWYGRISISAQDGGELANGFTWLAPYSGVEFALRRVASSVISLAPSDDYSYSGFMSARGLRKGIRCAVLCREDVADVAAEYLSHVSERPCTPLRHPGLPGGWSLFAQVLARRQSGAPAGLESIDVQATIGLIPSGGIRLGNRWTWLQGAPPRIIITGSDPGLAVTVDGEPATVAEDGMLQAERSLNGLGAHVIQVGPLRRTVEIVAPSLSVDSLAPRPGASPSSAPFVLALPAGGWTVVGSVPGQIARTKFSHRGGTIVECPFVPSWAIRLGPARGAIALSVSAGVPPAPDCPRRPTLAALSKHGYLPWATAIYDVAVRRPRVDSVIADVEADALRESWKSYSRCATEIKRAFRRYFR